MAKTRNTEEIQNPEEEQLENAGQEIQNPEEDQLEEAVVEEETAGDAQVNGIRCMVSQVKDGESKVDETLDEGWEADGVAIVDGNGETLLIVALNESELAFGGDESEDLEEDIPSPSMSSMDGQQRSAFLIAFYQRE